MQNVYILGTWAARTAEVKLNKKAQEKKKKEHKQQTDHQNLQILLAINERAEYSLWQKSQEKHLNLHS